MFLRGSGLFNLGVVSFVSLVACDSSIVGGGGLGGGGGAGGASSDVVTSGADPTEPVASTADGSTNDSSSPAATTGAGGTPPTREGVVVPRDELDVHILLANSSQSCAAPQTEPPCAPGEQWVATINMPRADLAPGTYELQTSEVGMNVVETSDNCSGFGGRGWSGDPAWLTVDSIDEVHAVITIEGAYDDVDGTWDVPLCGVLPA